MLAIGPSLPVLRYVWSFSRFRQPLRSTGNVATESLLQSLSPCPYGAMGSAQERMHQALGHLGTNPDHQHTYRHIQREGESHANPAAHGGISESA